MEGEETCELAGLAVIKFIISKTWSLRIWLLISCWPFWNLFSLESMLTARGLMNSAGAEPSSSSGLRHFAWSWMHTCDYWDFARLEHRSTLLAKKFKIQRDTHCVLSWALDNSKFKFLLCQFRTGNFLGFACLGSLWVNTDQRHPPGPPMLLLKNFSQKYSACEKKWKNKNKKVVLVKRQPDSAYGVGRMHHFL